MTDLPKNLVKILRFVKHFEREREVEQGIGQERKAVGGGVEQNREEVSERIRESWFWNFRNLPSVNCCISRK
jgi:hypothetical protein